MKILIQIIIFSSLLLTIGCNNGLEVESILEKKEPSLNELVNLMLKSADKEICLNKNNNNPQNKRILDLLIDNNLDCIKKQIEETRKGFNKEDSLIIITKWVANFFREPEFLIYDFSKSGRKLINLELHNAAFYRKSIKEKWYVAEQGFD